jgi:two-component system, OmpR family, sensor kinase
VRYSEQMVRWIGVLAHRAELTEQMRGNAIEQSRRAMAQELVAVVAHDVRNYLAPIELRVEVLRSLATRNQRSEELLREVDFISKAVGQMRTLVSDLLDVTRLDHGMFRIDPGVVDLAALVETSARALSRPGTRVDVRVQSTGRIIVFADATRLTQCLDNLIVNAIEKSPRDGTVTILITTDTEAEGERARVQIIDEGPGVPPELLPRIFERFSTSKGREGGLGLGLFLAKRIAELHGGDVTVESSPGSGARFTLALPCQLQSDEARPPLSKGANGGRASRDEVRSAS